MLLDGVPEAVAECGAQTPHDQSEEIVGEQLFNVAGESRARDPFTRPHRVFQSCDTLQWESESSTVTGP